MSKFRPNRNFRMEHLEDRRMMAGDVKAFTQDNILFIQEADGSIAGPQNFDIVQVSKDSVRVVGAPGTRINGNESQLFTFNPTVSKFIDVKLGGGRDVVRATGIANLSFGGIKIDTSDPASSPNDEDVVVAKNWLATLDVTTGSGRDVVQVLNSSLGGDLNIRAGIDSPGILQDRDEVLVQGTRIGRNLSVTTGASDDLVTLKSVDAPNGNQGAGGHISVNTGEGADTIKLGSNLLGTGPADLTPVTAAGTIHIIAGTDAQNDADIVQMQDVFADYHMVVELGAGNDVFDMAHATARGFISLAGQKGNDTMRLTEIESFDSVFAGMGEGSDTLTITNVKAPKVTLNGGDGDGYDKLFLSQSPNIGTLVRSAFEEINGQKLIKKTTPGVPVAR